jgi:hypothetical protein
MITTYLLLQKTLDERRLSPPKNAQVVARSQRPHPDGKTQAKRKCSTEDNQPTLRTEPASVHREEERREREDKCDEDEDGVDDPGYRDVSVHVQAGHIQLLRMTSRSHSSARVLMMRSLSSRFMGRCRTCQRTLVEQ